MILVLPNIFQPLLSSEIEDFRFFVCWKYFPSFALPLSFRRQEFLQVVSDWKNENLVSQSSEGVRKCSAALGRCGIWFLIDWYRFQTDLRIPTNSRARKPIFLVHFTLVSLGVGPHFSLESPFSKNSCSKLRKYFCFGIFLKQSSRSLVYRKIDSKRFRGSQKKLFANTFFSWQIFR